MESPIASLVRAAGIGSRPGDEQVARGPAACRRFRLAGIAVAPGRRETSPRTYWRLEALNNRGNALRSLNRPAEALASYDGALAVNPKDPEAWNNRGIIFIDLARYAEATDDFDKAIALRADFASLFCLLERYDEAGAVCDKALGIDISSNMLKIARQRQVYDKLVCGEIAFLKTHAKTFDLAVASDVFVYIGDLSKVFHDVRAALREGGFFGFSVEASDDQDFVLRTTRRYAHSRTYLRKLAEDHGFVFETIESQVIRQQDGLDVVGDLVILRSA